jgi:hypothetical protein
MHGQDIEEWIALGVKDTRMLVGWKGKQSRAIIQRKRRVQTAPIVRFILPQDEKALDQKSYLIGFAMLMPVQGPFFVLP